MIIHLIWIFAIIFAVTYLIYQYKEYGYLEILDYILSFVLGLFGALIGMVIMFMIVSLINSNADKSYYKTANQPIYCINDTSSTEGKSYLFSGYIKEKLVYRMFVDKDGGKQVLEVNASDSTVYEDGNNCIETYTEYYTNDRVKWWIGDEVVSSKSQYKVHIPKGSITTDYKLDLQ